LRSLREYWSHAIGDHALRFRGGRHHGAAQGTCRSCRTERGRFRAWCTPACSRYRTEDQDAPRSRPKRALSISALRIVRCDSRWRTAWASMKTPRRLQHRDRCSRALWPSASTTCPARSSWPRGLAPRPRTRLRLVLVFRPAVVLDMQVGDTLLEADHPRPQRLDVGSASFSNHADQPDRCPSVAACLTEEEFRPRRPPLTTFRTATLRGQVDAGSLDTGYLHIA